MSDLWTEIKRPAPPAYYGGGGTVPSGTYSQVPLASHQEITWPPMRAQDDSPTYVVAFSTSEIPDRVAQTSREPATSFNPRTLLGQRLWDIRTKGIASGKHLLSQEEIEHEIQDRRGGRDTEDV